MPPVPSVSLLATMDFLEQVFSYYSKGYHNFETASFLGPKIGKEIVDAKIISLCLLLDKLLDCAIIERSHLKGLFVPCMSDKKIYPLMYHETFFKNSQQACSKSFRCSSSEYEGCCERRMLWRRILR